MTKIEWTDYTINPGIFGCSPASSGCGRCYAARQAARLSETLGGPGTTNYAGLTTRDDDNRIVWTGEVRTADPSDVDAVFARRLPKHAVGRRCFVTSMADLFHGSVPVAFIDAVFAAMLARPHLSFQILTKRAVRLADYHDHRVDTGAGWPANVWAGVTVENQAAADTRLDELARCYAAPVRWASVEPLLGPVDLRRWTSTRGAGRLGWVVVGPENGPDRRPCEPRWVRQVAGACAVASPRVPVFDKVDLLGLGLRQFPPREYPGVPFEVAP